MHYSDRSRYECGGKCLRKRFFNYHFTDGQPEHRGVEPVGGKEELLFGQAIHHFVEDAWRSTTWPNWQRHNHWLDELNELVGEETTPDGLLVVDEYAALFTGLTDAFADYTLPALREEYEFVDAEKEYAFMVGETKWLGRFDVILRRKSDGLWFNVEAKTTSYPKELVKGASMNFQLLMEQHGMVTHYELREEQIGGSLLLIFDKGQRRRAAEAEQARGKDGYRRLSPFTYLYQKEYVSGVVKQAVEWTSGWERLASWTVPGWSQKMAEMFGDVRRSQVQLLPSVGFDRERLESVLRQVKSIEDSMAMGDMLLGPKSEDAAVIDGWWPQTFTNCFNDGGFGKACSYLALCQSPRLASDPTAEGDYQWRTPNHPEQE